MVFQSHAEPARLAETVLPASIRQISAALYKKPFSTNGLANGWVGETQARPETGSITPGKRADLILVEEVPSKPEWAAVQDRLARSAVNAR